MSHSRNLAFSSLFSQAIFSGAYLIMPNLYSPADFANYSSLFGYATILASILSFKSEFIIVPNSETGIVDSDYDFSSNLTALSFLISFVIFSVIGLLEDDFFLLSIPLIAYGISMQNVLKMRTIGYGMNDNFPKLQIISSIFRALLTVIFSVFGKFGLLSGEVLSRTLFFQPRKIIGAIKWAANVKKTDILRLSSLGIYGSLISFTDALIINAMYVLPLHITASAKTAAIIALAARIGSLPISLISIPMGDYIYSSYGTNKQLFQRRLFTIVAASIGAVCLLLVFVYLYEKFFLYEQFSGLINLMLILSPMILSQIIYNTISRFIFLFNIMKLKLITDITQIFTLFCFFLFGTASSYNLAILFCSTRTIAYAILIFFILRCIRLSA